METICVYPDPNERQAILAYLLTLPIEYHKPYKRFNQIVKVPMPFRPKSAVFPPCCPGTPAKP